MAAPRRKPSLVQSIAVQHFWATALTLTAVMLGLLVLANYLTVHARQVALVRGLRAVESVDAGMAPAVGIYAPEVRERGGYVLLDAGGRRVGDLEPPRGPRGRQGRHWPLAAQVLETGELAGRGQLPWVPEPVIWAARVMYNADGERMILVSWHRISAIHAMAMRSSYAMVVLAVLLAFGVSVVLAMRTARGMTRVLADIANSSSRMAAGDFGVRLPERRTAEFDKVSSSINRLAHDLEQATAALDAERERLRRLELLQRQFVADASHELRAPLTSMRVTLEAWQDGILREEERPAALARVLKETERLGLLVSGLLDLSRIESGREPVAPEPVAMEELAAEVADGFAAGPGAPVVVAVLAGSPPVLADRGALFRILHNLVENARRFTAPDGSIRIAMACEETTARIMVEDTGCGIDPQDLPRIWDRFARAGEARAAGKSGSGLGLAIVKALAEAMGGEVGAASTPGAGATVWVRLPLAHAELLLP